MTISLRPLCTASFALALALAPASAQPQSAPQDEGTDEGVISTCSLYYENAPVDCSHFEAGRAEASATEESSIQPLPTVESREDTYATRIAPSTLPETRLLAAPLPGSAFGSSDLTAVRSGAPEADSSLYVEAFDPARTYTRR